MSYEIHYFIYRTDVKHNKHSEYRGGIELDMHENVPYDRLSYYLARVIKDAALYCDLVTFTESLVEYLYSHRITGCPIFNSLQSIPPGTLMSALLQSTDYVESTMQGSGPTARFSQRIQEPDQTMTPWTDD